MPAQTTDAKLRWVVCGLLFLVTTINYIDRSALGLVEPILKPMLGGDANLALYNQHYSSIVTCFIVAYGLGFLVSGRSGKGGRPRIQTILFRLPRVRSAGERQAHQLSRPSGRL